MILYFSGTGNSRWVAQQLASVSNERIYDLSKLLFSDVYELKRGEALGFVFPVHAWGPPEIVLRCISLLKLSAVPDYVYFVCTCGDDTGKTEDLFCRAVSGRGWHCDAGFSVVMPNTYVCLPGFDVDALNVEKVKCEKAKERLTLIEERVFWKKHGFDCKEGRMPWLKTYVVRPLFVRYLMSAKAFHATDACISCGECEKVCPVHNIRMLSGRPSWGNDCTMCLACYHHCPRHAVAYGRKTAKKGQYFFRNKSVSR